MNALVVVVFSLVACSWRISASASCPGKLLYNGICLPTDWPPRYKLSRDLPSPPYLDTPPDVINIDVGRQLFVDTFLIGNMANVTIQYHTPVYQDQINPVLRADKEWEGAEDMTTAYASPYSGGLFWDPAKKLYKLWYTCQRDQCYAESEDLVTWKKPILDVVDGTNIVLQNVFGSNTYWLDLDDPNPSQRFKMANSPGSFYEVYTSSDGLHWEKVVNQTGDIADRSTVFYNPFLKKWVWSIKRSYYGDGTSNPVNIGRSRMYWEGDSLLSNYNWTFDELYNWTCSDTLDPPAVYCNSLKPHDNYTQLYNLDAVAYESVVVGLFTLMTGKMCGPDPMPPYNRTGEWTSVFLGFSRDGFSWYRPLINGQHPVFLPMNDTTPQPPWVWSLANVESVAGGFVVDDYSNVDRGLLVFMASGHTGYDMINGNASAGIAQLRRDGFASIALQSLALGQGIVQTRPLSFARGRFLFLNSRGASGGAAAVRAEVADASGNPVPPFTLENCLNVGADTTREMVQWNDGKGGVVSDLQALQNITVILRFQLVGDAELFSFWVSPSKCGESMGYVAGGGPSFDGNMDTNGSCLH